MGSQLPDERHLVTLRTHGRDSEAATLTLTFYQMADILRGKARPSFLLFLFGALACAASWLPNRASAGACGLVNFNAAPTVAVSNRPNAVVTGDFDGDGRPDLAVSNQSFSAGSQSEVEILLNTGGGNFRVAHRLRIPTASAPGFVAAGDFNGDGKSDVVATAVDYADVYVFLSQGVGFAQPAAIVTGLKPGQVAVADFNGDSKRDFAVANRESDTISVLLGDGAGGFAAPKNTYSYGLEGFAAGDFNNDGKTDIIEGTHMLLGDGAGNFSVGPPLFTFGSNITKTGDFNGDGKLDILMADSSGGSALVRFGDGAGGFNGVKELRPVSPTGFAVGDFDSDGKTDFASASYVRNQVFAFYGDGAGGFALPDKYVAGSRPAGVAAADFDGDSRPDLAVINQGSDDVSLLLGKGGRAFGAPRNVFTGAPDYIAQDPLTAVTADFNGDGKPDLGVLKFSSHEVAILLNDGAGGLTLVGNLPVPFLSRWVTTADVNGDGKVDLVIAHRRVGSDSATVWLGRGDGTFTPGANSGTGWVITYDDLSYVTAGDVNNDGKADLAFISASGSVRISVGNNQWFTPAGSFTVPGTPLAITLCDLNEDGKTDYAVTRTGNIGLDLKDAVFIAFGDGAGGVSSTKAVELRSPQNSVAGDFDGDGHQDLAFTGGVLRSDGLGSSGVTVLLGDGAGGFPRTKSLEVLGARGIASGDFDGDGRPDLAVTTYEDQNQAALLLGDGAGGFVQAARYGVGADPRTPAVADFNGDGKLDLAVPNYISSDVTMLFATACVAATPTPTPAANPLDQTTFFVSQHYRDFLGREPDASGLAFWTQEIEQCGADAQCREVKRVNVSAAFFLSIEFQQTGYLAYRARKVAFGDLPNRPVPVTRAEMLADMQIIGNGLVVNADGWEQKLEQNKQAYFEQLAASERFTSKYPGSWMPGQFVFALKQNAGGALSQVEADALEAQLNAGTMTRAQALRAVAEDPDLAKAEFNKAFVLMQYFGYLRRNPDDLPDVDFAGWNFWLGKLELFGGDYVRAEMVKAFLSSDEYRNRFVQ